MTYPEKLMLRDTALHDDLGGLGQPIFTTAGQGYTKVEYVRGDIVETLRRSLAAAKQVIKSKEAIQSIQNGRLKDMNEAISTLASEREANAVMTEEIETLRQRVKELEESEKAGLSAATTGRMRRQRLTPN